MKWTLGAVAMTVTGVAALGFGGYIGNRYLACQSLEEDYLNSVSKMKSMTATLGLLGSGDVGKALRTIRESSMKVAESTLLELNQQCGSQAADTALRKGSELLLG